MITDDIQDIAFIAFTGSIILSITEIIYKVIVKLFKKIVNKNLPVYREPE